MPNPANAGGGSTLDLLSLAAALGGPLFGYGGFCTAPAFVVATPVPETQGQTLEEIEQRWTGRQGA